MKSFSGMHDYFLILFGPTGVGKSEISLQLSQHLPAEIVNIDMGQFYTPLSIGTAKPNWRTMPVPHHLFDILNDPVNFTVIDYRKCFLETVGQIWQRNNLPIVVGGSCFYVHALFFPPRVGVEEVLKRMCPVNDADLWKQLYEVDPERALKIHSHDIYRIKRALEIWYITGKKPSALVPFYNPPAPFTLICLTRDRADLYNRIDKRTEEMIDTGWIDEVRALLGTPWEQFVRTKKLIGYSEILDYLEGKRNLPETIERIKQETRNYAKRQLIFWRMMEKQLRSESFAPTTTIETVNLTSTDLDLYIKQLSKRLTSLLS
jgi:tRNA dimethylallyltransferase